MSSVMPIFGPKSRRVCLAWIRVCLASLLLFQVASEFQRGRWDVRAEACPSFCPKTCEDSSVCGVQYAGPVDYCRYPGIGCDNGQTAIGNCCCIGSPILLDLAGAGFALSSLAAAVPFEMGTNGYRHQVAWPLLHSGNAWLAFDRNGNDRIDNVTELFGDCSPQGVGPPRNGFASLAVLDDPRHGGNGDRFVDARDVLFRRLRLWQDRNRNGLSETEELIPLSESGVLGFDLRFAREPHFDAHGNLFLYKSRVLRKLDSLVGEWAWDVYPLVANE